MSILAGKNVLLGVTASIAAYKSAYIVRELIKAGANVRVIVTPASLDFISPLTLGTLSKNPVLHEFVSDKEAGTWNKHVDIGLWADNMLIAPASANTISKMAGGLCDNFLLAVYLSAKCPVYFAPAMDLDMHAHPANQKNIDQLVKRGNILIDAESGELASGLEGKGRMAEPENIIRFLKDDLLKKAAFFGKRILISAGPTLEAIDPVRYIGNRSSGKMGFALAGKMASLGAEVILVSGPVALTTPKGNVKRIDVESADEMYEACLREFPKADFTIMSAAVSDFKPKRIVNEKIKKDGSELQIDLIPTPDILSKLGQLKSKYQILVGFALETQNEIENARVKLEKKNCDFIVLNSLRDKGAGFAHDSNKISIISRNINRDFELKSKDEVAGDICNFIIDSYL